MSCCGKARTRASTGTRANGFENNWPANEFPFGSVFFEYTGLTSMAIIGPASRKTYHFDGPGSRVMVDQRDSGSFAMVRALRRV